MEGEENMYTSINNRTHLLGNTHVEQKVFQSFERNKISAENISLVSGSGGPVQKHSDTL